jgi:hypothetical protein
MPVVEVKLTAGRTDQQKDKIIAGITEVLVDTLNVRTDKSPYSSTIFPNRTGGFKESRPRSLGLERDLSRPRISIRNRLRFS